MMLYYFILHSHFYNNNSTSFLMDVGWGNGYVLIPESHPFYMKDYDSIDVYVHGGLTFSSDYELPQH